MIWCGDIVNKLLMSLRAKRGNLVAYRANVHGYEIASSFLLAMTKGKLLPIVGRS